VETTLISREIPTSISHCTSVVIPLDLSQSSDLMQLLYCYVKDKSSAWSTTKEVVHMITKPRERLDLLKDQW